MSLSRDTETANVNQKDRYHRVVLVVCVVKLWDGLARQAQQFPAPRISVLRTVRRHTVLSPKPSVE